MTSGKLAHLGKLTEAAFLAEQARLKQLTRQEADLRAQLARLQEDRAAAARADRPIGEAALSAGADVRWHQWIAVRQTRLNNELLHVLTLKRYQLDKVRKAHGRAQALDALTERARLEEARKAASRLDRDA